jgi:hypothetical protein
MYLSERISRSLENLQSSNLTLTTQEIWTLISLVLNTLKNSSSNYKTPEVNNLSIRQRQSRLMIGSNSKVDSRLMYRSLPLIRIKGRTISNSSRTSWIRRTWWALKFNKRTALIARVTLVRPSKMMRNKQLSTSKVFIENRSNRMFWGRRRLHYWTSKHSRLTRLMHLSKDSQCHLLNQPLAHSFTLTLLLNTWWAMDWT